VGFAEATSLNPGFQNLGGGRASLNAKEEALVNARTGEGIFVQVVFAGGRAIDILTDVSSINPGGAEVLESTIFAELGSANLEIDERDRSYPARRWVWVDGDVRIAYEHRTETNGARDLSLELIAYPVFLEGLEAEGAPAGKTQRQLLVQQTKQEWGAQPKPNPYASKPLPNALEGLELGGSPLQVSVVFPGANMNSTPDETYNGTYRLRNGNEVYFQFLDNKLERICEDRLDVPSERFDEFRDQLTDQYGKTTIESLLGSGWTNDKINFYYRVAKDRPGQRPVMVICIEDKQLLWAESQESAPPAQYKTAPASHSFFLPTDLPTRQ
jgi:hypothetical protein